MTVIMPKNIKEERLRWVLPLVRKEVKLKDMVLVCPHSERSLKRWKKAFLEYGEEGLEPLSTAPKTQPHETPIRIKEEVLSIRGDEGLCAKKIHWRLAKKGLRVPVSTIGKILKQEGVTRKYRKRKITYKYVRALRKPGEVIEIDVKHVPGPIAGKKYYQYTSIDLASRWRYLAIYPEETTGSCISFLRDVIERFPYQIQAIKTDNHATFTNYYIGTNGRDSMTVKTIHALDRYCADRGITHYLIDRGKPAQNGTVERSHREDEEKFYQKNTFSSFDDLKIKVRKWNLYYNELEHCSLEGKSPNEALILMGEKGTEVVS